MRVCGVRHEVQIQTVGGDLVNCYVPKAATIRLESTFATASGQETHKRYKGDWERAVERLRLGLE